MKALTRIFLIAIVFLFSMTAVQQNEVKAEENDSKLKVEYFLDIPNFSEGKANLELIISNIQSDTLNVKEHHGFGYFTDVEKIAAFDTKTGNVLEVKLIGTNQGSYNTIGQEWQISTSGVEKIKIKYTVHKQKVVHPDWQDEYRGYIGNHFAYFIAAEVMSIFPSELFMLDDDIQINLSVPKGASIFTPWHAEGGNFFPNKNKEFEDSWEWFEHLMRTSILIGDFNSFSSKIGDTSIQIASPKQWTSDFTNQARSDVLSLLDYYTWLFGESVGKNFMVAFFPESHSGVNITPGENCNSLGSSKAYLKDSYSIMEHALFHRWNGWNYGWFWDWEKNGDAFTNFFGESNDIYYESKAAISLRDQLYFVDKNVLNKSRNFCEEYKKGGKDIFFKQVCLWVYLDMKIFEDSKGQYSADDLHRILFSEYGHRTGRFGLEEVVSIIKDLTGKNYQSFFEKYVLGNEVFHVDGYFKDDDWDGESNYEEIVRDMYKKRLLKEKVFSDVKRLDYYFDAVESLSKRGVVSGYPDGTFKPNNAINRAEAVSIIAAALGINGSGGEDLDFYDVKKQIGIINLWLL